MRYFLPLLFLVSAYAADKSPLVLDATNRPSPILTTDTLRVRSTGGIATEQAATQDRVALLGRAGGTGSFTATFTPAALTASRTITIPDATGTLALLQSAQTFTAAQKVQSNQSAVADLVIQGAAGTQGWLQFGTADFGIQAGQDYVGMNLRTNGATRLSIDTAGAISVAGPLSGVTTLANSGIHSNTNTTSASSSIVGAFLVGDGVAATNVAIGGGNINTGGTLTVGGAVLSSTSVGVKSTGSPKLGLQVNAGTADDWGLYSDSVNHRFKIVNNTSGYGEVFSISRAGAVTLPYTLAVTGVATIGPSSGVTPTGFSRAHIQGASAVANDLTLSGPVTSQTRLTFSAPAQEGFGAIGYDHAINLMTVVAGNAPALTMSGTVVSCLKTLTASSSTAGAFTVGNGVAATNVAIGGGNINAGGIITSSSPTLGIGYATGAGGTVTQITSRATGVTSNTVTHQITMFAAAGSATPATYTVTCSAVAATDSIIINDVSGSSNTYFWKATPGSGSYTVTFWTTGGTASDTPVIRATIIKGSSS